MASKQRKLFRWILRQEKQKKTVYHPPNGFQFLHLLSQMKYKVLYKIPAENKDANKLLKEAQKIARSPFIHVSKKTGYPLIILFETDDLAKANRAISFYKEKGVQSWLITDV